MEVTRYLTSEEKGYLLATFKRARAEKRSDPLIEHVYIRWQEDGREILDITFKGMAHGQETFSRATRLILDWLGAL